MTGLAGWLGLSALAHGPVPDRIDALTEEIEHHRGDATLLARRGELYLLDGNGPRAVTDLERAWALDPDLAHVDLLLARALLLVEEPARASAVLDRRLAHEPSHGRARALRAEARIAQGDRTGALADYDAAVRNTDPPRPDLFLARAALIPDAAARAASLQEGVARVGPVAALVQPLVRAQLEQGDPEGALATLDALPRGLARSPSWLTIRGRVLAEAGRRAEAEAAYERALASIDALPEARRDVPAMRAQRAEIQAARSDLESSLQAPPGALLLLSIGGLVGLGGLSALLRRKASSET